MHTTCLETVHASVSVEMSGGPQVWYPGEGATLPDLLGGAGVTLPCDVSYEAYELHT